MPTTVSKAELDELRELIEDHIERTGVSVTQVSVETGIRREVISKIRSGKYPSSPTIEIYKKLLSFMGKKWVVVDQ